MKELIDKWKEYVEWQEQQDSIEYHPLFKTVKAQPSFERFMYWLERNIND